MVMIIHGDGELVAVVMIDGDGGQVAVMMTDGDVDWLRWC